jgi:hypothetical protein
VLAVASVKGEGFLPTAWKPLRFSGYDWEVRTIASDRGGGTNNPYSGYNAFKDISGALHLRITKKDGKWVCAEMRTTRSPAYHTYVVTVRDTSHLEPASVFSMITWDDNGDPHDREMDVEISRSDDAANKNNAQFGVRPFYVPGNLARIEVEIAYCKKQFRLRVRDDGRGIDPRVTAEGERAGPFGLHGMRERAERMGGQLDVSSEPGAGTEIELRIPGSIAYRSSAIVASEALPRKSKLSPV